MRLLEFFRPFRVIATRRVSEEEQVSIEAFAGTEALAVRHTQTFLDVFTQHRANYNDKAVNTFRQQLLAVEGKLENRGEELRQVEQELDAKRAELAKVEGVLAKKKERAGLSSAS